MELRDSLRLLREQWKVMLAVVIVVTATSGLFTWQVTPQYTSQVTMFVSAWGGSDDTASAAYQGTLLSQQKVKSYTELLRGQHVMSSVIDSLELEVTPRELAGQVTSSAIPDTALLTATVRDPSPERAQQIANAIGEEFATLIPILESVAEDQQAAVRVTVVSPAELPMSPTSPRPVRNLVLALVLGLLLGAGVAVARRALDTTVKSAEQAAEIGEAPSLGVVPFDTTAQKRPLLSPAAHGSRMEALRKIRTSLDFVNVDRSHKVVAVTSAMPGEGKSVTSCNLAVTMAEVDKRVLIIDGDLRRPSVARYLGLPNGVGLTNVLLGQVHLEEAVQWWGGRLFSVLTSGPVPPNPTALLGSGQMRELLKYLRTCYDVILIDSPPVIPIADAAVLAAVSDGAVVVVRHGKTKLDQVSQTMTALRAAEVPLLGTILNGAPKMKSSYYEYRYMHAGQVDARRAADSSPTPAHR